MSRLSWPEYFMGIALLVAERSTCLRRRVGAVAVKDKRILATGYNGAPSKTAHCLDVGCMRTQLNIPSGERHELCRGLHAEQNVIIQAAVHGISLSGCEVYCTTQPCFICAKMLINCGVTSIWYAEGYPDELATAMLKEAGVHLERLLPVPTGSTLSPKTEAALAPECACAGKPRSDGSVESGDSGHSGGSCASCTCASAFAVPGSAPAEPKTQQGAAAPQSPHTSPYASILRLLKETDA